MSDDTDDTQWFDQHLGAIRDANQDESLAGAPQTQTDAFGDPGQFTLERLWLNDGAAFPVFVIGDCIEKIEGRGYTLKMFGDLYPEIVQITIFPQSQKMRLLTRDLTFSDRRLT